jgi:membrane-associated phospholipid phosphatase
VIRLDRTVLSGIIALALVSRAVAAQAADSSHSKTFFTGRDGLIGLGILGASVGLSLFDARIAQNFQDTSHLHVRAGERVDDIFTHVNESTLTVGGLAVYVFARVARATTVATVAFHVSEAVAAASISNQLVRGPLGRTRPRDAHPAFENQYDFQFLKGFTHFQNRAFPSIHSSSGFAAASVIVAEVQHRAPAAAWWVGVPAYAFALTPGLSRMYLGQHWASDILSGAAVGTFYGWRIVQYSRSHPTTPVDRLFLGKANRAPAFGRAIPISVHFSF